MKILKNKGLDQANYDQRFALSQDLPKCSAIKKMISVLLSTIFGIHKSITEHPLLVNSDII
jgi:hypothetical protein